jgi:plasmid maintenance system antidote protein VapI
MIRDNDQLTRAREEKESLLSIREKFSGDDLQNRMNYASLSCRIKDLQQEIEEYELLTHTNKTVFCVDNLDKSITSLRIAAGISTKELAERLEIPEQQIQRFEEQNYLKVEWERIIQIIRVLSPDMKLYLPLQRKERKYNQEEVLKLIS